MSITFLTNEDLEDIHDRIDEIDVNNDPYTPSANTKSPIVLAKFHYRNLSDFTGDTDELKARNIANYDVFVYQGVLSNELAMSSSAYFRDFAIYQRVLEINPEFKMFGYVTARGFGYISGTSTTQGMTEYRKTPTGLDHVIWTKEELFDFMNLMAHCGGTVDTASLDEYGNPIRTGGIPMYGVFYDDFGYNYATQNEHLLNQGDWTSVRDKQNSLIDYAHGLGLSNMPNDSPDNIFYYDATDDYYNPDGIRSNMDERDWFSLESYFIRSDYKFYGSDASASRYIENYKDKYKSKGLALTYIYAVEDDGTGETKQTAATFALYQALCQGLSAIALHGFTEFVKIPTEFSEYYDTDGSAVYSRDSSTWTYTLEVNGRKVSTIRSTAATAYGQTPNTKNLSSCKVVLDDTDIIGNIFVRTSELMEQFKSFKTDVAEEFESIKNDDEPAESIYYQATIDDWAGAYSIDEYTNIAPTFSGNYGGEDTNTTVVWSSNAPRDISITMPSAWSWRRIDFNASDLAGRTVELGFKSMKLYPTDGSDATCNCTWKLDNPSTGSTIVTLGSTEYNESIDGTTRQCVRFTVPEDAGTYQFWVLGYTSTYSGTHTIDVEGFYIIDVSEKGYEPQKTWYTNYAPSMSTWLQYDTYGNIKVTLDDDGQGFTVDYLSSAECSEIYIPFSTNSDILLPGETWEIGVQEYRCWDDAGNDITDKMQIWFNTSSIRQSGLTFNYYANTKADYESMKSDLKPNWICLKQSTIPDTYSGGMTSVQIRFKPSNYMGGSSETNLYHMYVRGLYLYKLDERDELTIRGEDPSNTYIVICRVTESNLATDEQNRELKANALYVTDAGNLFVTDRSGNRIDIVRH